MRQNKTDFALVGTDRRGWVHMGTDGCGWMQWGAWMWGGTQQRYRGTDEGMNVGACVMYGRDISRF